MKKTFKAAALLGMFVAVFSVTSLILLGAFVQWKKYKEEMKNICTNPNCISVVDSVCGKLFLFGVDTVTWDILYTAPYKKKGNIEELEEELNE